VTANARRARGFTLVEVVVTLFVLAVALMIASGLLLESVRIFASSGRELREPPAELTLRLLREDVRASAPLFPGEGGAGPLDCRRAERTDRWELVGDRLVRRGIGPLDEDLGARPMLDKVQGFAWSVPVPGLVEIRIVRRKPSGASAITSPTSAWRPISETVEVATLVAGSRIEAP
jgi:prepilin-type N-terminal cleavage/methylation domain-containing protein